MTELTAQYWQKLAELPERNISALFRDDAQRLEQMTRRLDLGGCEILFDFSKTHLGAEELALFEQLADAAHLAGMRDQLFAGAKINSTEDRAVEHMAERGSGAENSVAEAAALHQRMAALIDAIGEGVMGEIDHVLHIGIGGSALGPKLIVDALGRDEVNYDVAVVSNIDGAALQEAFDRLDPERTVLAIASKTFTTTETLLNAQSAISWMRSNGVADPYGRAVALTAAPEKALEWGIDETRILPFRESVGGRYSIWSSIGFPAAMALGNERFAEMLKGASAMDRHFRDQPWRSNMPVMAAFADLYYLRKAGCQTRAIFAYDERLRLLPDYLQQLEMESNGKSALRDGSMISGPSAPISWGGVGTDAQHAVFQLLHQGTHMVPVEFIAARHPGHDLDPQHHQTLLANCFAQGAALMQGRDNDDAARYYPGNRPSTTLLLDDVDAFSLGALIAFYEHRTFANAVLLGINAFDQFGVELGKQIAKTLGSGETGDFDPSTLALLKAVSPPD